MKKRLILSLLLSTSLYSQSARVPSLCESAFLKSYSSFFVKYRPRNIKGAPVESILALSKVDDIGVKLKKLEREYQAISMEYNDKKAQLKIHFEELAEDHNLDFELIQSMMEEPLQQLYVDTVKQVNAITTVVHKTLVDEGMQVILKQRSVKGTKDLSNYLEVVDLPSKKYFNSIATINRYKKRFGTKTVTFDFGENLQSGSAGFSMSEIKRIDLGFRGMRNMVLDDLITMVGKHEFKHASFASKRVKGKESIYHAQYMSNGESPISSVPNHYSHYMSAEELYNFTNNPFWASNRIGDIANYRPQDYLSDVDGIFYYIKETEKIAAQTKEVTENTIKYLTELLDNPQRMALEMNFLTSQRAMAKSADDAFYIHFKMPKDIVYMDWVNKTAFKEEFTKIIENRIMLDKKYRASFDAAKGDKKKKILELYAKDESRLNAETNKGIVKMLIKKQESLNKVASNIIPLNQEATKKTEEFIGKILIRRKLQPNYLATTEAQEDFLKLRHVYRKLGNHVKEDFKGFIGK